MTYPDAIQFLQGLQLFGAKLGLGNTLKLAASLGNPQSKLRFIHVAGTNGKGSTCAILESIYRAAGLCVGLYTSPHLVSVRERIQINREWISQEDLTSLVAELRPLIQQLNLDDQPTFFEVVTVLGIMFFARRKCDLVIWETGLGGRLDATNIVTPLVSVITNIAFDHQEWLGDTLEKIAAEKSGIIKPGVPVVTGADEPEAWTEIARIAKANAAPLSSVCDTVKNFGILPGHASIGLAGEHQKRNASVAVQVVEVLQPQIPVPKEAILAGLASVNWPGRLQRLSLPDGRVILLDGAHNTAGAAALRAALSHTMGGISPVLIFGVLDDKQWGEMCVLLAGVAKRVITVPVASERTADPAEIAAAFRAARPDLRAVAMLSLTTALAECAREPFVLITGSLYLVGEALEQLGSSPMGGGERELNEWIPARKLQ